MSSIEDMKKKKSQINEIVNSINNNDLSAFKSNFEELKDKFPNDKELVYQEIYSSNEIKSIYQSALNSPNNEIFKEVYKNSYDKEKNNLINTSELLKSVESNNEEKVSLLLKRGADPFAFDENGDYIIQKAVEKNNPSIVNELISSMQQEPDTYELLSEDVLNKCSETASKVDTYNYDESKKGEYVFMLAILESNGADIVLNNEKGNSIALENMIVYSNEEGVKYLIENHKQELNINNPEFINKSLEKVFENAYFEDSPINGTIDKRILENLIANDFKVELGIKNIHELTQTIKSEEVRDLTKELINNGFDIQSHKNAFANDLINRKAENIGILKEFVIAEKIGSKEHDKLISNAIQNGYEDVAKEIISNAEKLENPSNYFSKATEKSMVNNEFDNLMGVILDKSENKVKVLNDSLVNLIDKMPESTKVIANYDFKINDEVKALYKEKNQELSNLVNKKELNTKLSNKFDERKKDKGFKI